jgi:hypothetical protein
MIIRTRSIRTASCKQTASAMAVIPPAQFRRYSFNGTEGKRLGHPGTDYRRRI